MADMRSIPPVVLVPQEAVVFAVIIYKMECNAWAEGVHILIILARKLLGQLRKYFTKLSPALLFILFKIIDYKFQQVRDDMKSYVQ